MENFNYSQFSFNNYTTCYIKDGTIYQITGLNNEMKPIGVTNDEMEKALTKAETYYNRLVELGDIVPEKTQEDFNKEQSEFNQQVLATLTELTNQLKELKTNEHSSDSKDAGDRPKFSKPGTK